MRETFAVSARPERANRWLAASALIAPTSSSGPSEDTEEAEEAERELEVEPEPEPELDDDDEPELREEPDSSSSPPGSSPSISTGGSAASYISTCPPKCVRARLRFDSSRPSSHEITCGQAPRPA